MNEYQHRTFSRPETKTLTTERCTKARRCQSPLTLIQITTTMIPYTPKRPTTWDQRSKINNQQRQIPSQITTMITYTPKQRTKSDQQRLWFHIYLTTDNYKGGRSMTNDCERDYDNYDLTYILKQPETTDQRQTTDTILCSSYIWKRVCVENATGSIHCFCFLPRTFWL